MRISAKVLFIFMRLYRGFARRVMWFYHYLTLGQLGRGTSITSKVHIEHPYNVFIGRNCNINQYALLQGSPSGKINIGNDVVISYGAIVLTATRKYVDGVYSMEHESKSVMIEDGAWIAARALVLPGVKIGAGSMVAAGAVVTHDVEPNTVVAGIPAKPIRNLKSKNNS